MTTLRLALHNRVTVEYPTEQPLLAPRFMAHPVLTWDETVAEPYCTGCLICMRICPTDVITVSMKDNPKLATGESTRKKIVDDFELNIADCIMCGLCVEYCNFDAIMMSDDFDLSKQSRTNLVQGLDELLDGGRAQVAKGRWTPPETKKSQRRSAAQGRTTSSTAASQAADASQEPGAAPPAADVRVEAARARAAELRAQRALERGDALVQAPAATAAQTESPSADVDSRVAEGRRKAAELRAQKALERGEAVIQAPPTAPVQPEIPQADVDPRVAEGRRKAAELRAQKALERGEAVIQAPQVVLAQPEIPAADIDPRVVEGRRKAAELRAQRALEKSEQGESGDGDQRQ
ncbi:MAG: 4Fe-4S dicluster domain-containing protein [Chloroflexi bacterium]|nr:4Fe-4S dicluster domain-containing protein [Chloroflexota bacterium]